MSKESFNNKIEGVYKDLRTWARLHYSPKDFAEDLVQDVALKLLDKFEQEGLDFEKRITNLWGYSLTAMSNTAISQFRKRKRRGELVVIVDDIEIDGVAQPTSADEHNLIDLFSHYKKLSRNSRDIIYDIKIAGMKSDEVANKDKKSPNTVRGTLSDNLKKYDRLIKE